MKGRCKDCNFWEANKRTNDHKWIPEGRELLGECSSKKFIYGAEGERPFPDDSLVYDDFESYDAGFETGRNFGCIHFKARS